MSDGPEAPPEVPQDPAGDPVPYRPYVPYVPDPPPAGGGGTQFARLNLSDPLRWLALGARDLARAPGTGLFFGGVFALMGLIVLAVFRHAPAYTLALCAGFLLLGPLLCLGLYDTSRRLERGEPPSLIDAIGAWLDNVSQIAIFGAALLVLEMLWGRAALVVFAVSFDGMPDFAGSVARLLDAQHAGFVAAYLGVGALFGGLIFSVSVIAMPLLLDRDTDAISAALLSLKLCLTQPLVMAFWGMLITLLVVLAMLPMFAGLLVVGPWLGHASWHAYRAVLPNPTAPG